MSLLTNTLCANSLSRVIAILSVHSNCYTLDIHNKNARLSELPDTRSCVQMLVTHLYGQLLYPITHTPLLTMVERNFRYD